MRGVELAWDSVARAVNLLIIMDEKRALANATPFLFAFGHAIVGWLWLDVAVLSARRLPRDVGDAEGSFFEGKLRACRYFTAYELPRIDAWLSPIFTGANVAREMTLAQLFRADIEIGRT